MTEYKIIVDKAKAIKENVDKEHTLKIPEQWACIFAKSIIKPTAQGVAFNIKKAPKPHGDKIKLDIKKEDYLKLAKNLIAFVNHNKRMPNWIGYKNKRIRARLYCYMFATAVVYYSQHHKLPAKIHLDSTIFAKPKIFKKYGHATIHGCNNMGQNNNYYCGPHSLQEVIRNLTGKVISQEQLASWAGTTPDGTDHDGLNTAVAMAAKKLNVKLSVQWKNFSEIGWEGIRKILISNNQDIVCHNYYRNQWGHYEAINMVYSDYADIQNSLGDSCSGSCYCGYVEERYLSTHESYMKGISQKSIMIITREK